MQGSCQDVQDLCRHRGTGGGGVGRRNKEETERSAISVTSQTKHLDTGILSCPEIFIFFCQGNNRVKASSTESGAVSKKCKLSFRVNSRPSWDVVVRDREIVTCVHHQGWKVKEATEKQQEPARGGRLQGEIREREHSQGQEINVIAPGRGGWGDGAV